MCKKFRGACKNQHTFVTTRQLKHFDQTEFINDLLLVDWKASALNGDNSYIIVKKWTSTFSLILENMLQFVISVFLNISVPG